MSATQEARKLLEDRLGWAHHDINRALGDKGLARMRGHASRARDALRYATGRMKIRDGDYPTVYGPKLVEQLDLALAALGKALDGERDGERRRRLEYGRDALGDLRDGIQEALDALKDAQADEKATKAAGFPRNKERRERLQMQARTIGTALDVLDKLGRDYSRVPEPEHPRSLHTMLVDAIPLARGQGVVATVDIEYAVKTASAHVGNQRWDKAWITLERIADAYEEAALDA